MNNERLEIDAESEVDQKPYLEDRKVILIRLLESINNLSKNDDWNTLNELLFKENTQSLAKRLLSESNKTELNAAEIYRLQGEQRVAKRYDIYKLAETYKLELNNITQKLNENATS